MHRISAIKCYANNGEEIQRKILSQLIHEARNTDYGIKYNYKEIRNYDDFRSQVPLVHYDDLRPYIMRMVNGEKNVLWHGKCNHFAQSSGTSDGRSKYIPITDESFRDCHYQGGFDTVANYLNLNPDSRMFSGKGFILGGSFANEITPPPGVKVGDLSANLIENINPLANLVRIPSKEVALIADWSKKLPLLVESSMGQNVTNISGVPSWFLTVIKEVLKKHNANSIHEVWPNLEVFFHGGISFTPYRNQYESICDMSKMHFLETYNASEGFFAVQDSWDTNAMLLLLDIGIFFEFLPLSEINSEHPSILPIWEIEKGKTYALVMTANNGLWRYFLGDTVKIESTAPVKIRIAGRTKHFINAFGEELMVYNADEAIAASEAKTNLHIVNYTVAPVYPTASTKGCHQWLIEFSQIPSKEELSNFIAILDENLRKVNSDYDAKRSQGIFLDPPCVTIARNNLFDDWLKSSGKLGGQRKIPRLSNDRDIIEKMLEINNSNL